MYEDHFGLKSNPFRANAEGANVFVGPTQTKIITRIHTALSAADNVVTVSGPAGVGKTTIVTRALETNQQHQMVAWIGRMRLDPDEVLQLLLAGFGITRRVPGTVRQFALFQRMLSERAEADTRVVIVVEDALRIGNEALLELEAITATDTGNVGGANIVLMGPPEIDKRLNFPELARLRQRSRMGQKIAALTVTEVQGYLRHCLRVAGKEYDELFDEDVAAMLYRLSEGVPRVINNICDAALEQAAQENQDRITRQLVLEVAADVYGLEPILDEPPVAEEFLTPGPVTEKLIDIEPEANVAPEPEPDNDPAPEQDPEPEHDVEPEPLPTAAYIDDPVPVSAFDSEPEPATVSAMDPAALREPDRPAHVEPVAEMESQPTTHGLATSPKPELPAVVAAALAQEMEECSEQPQPIAITGLQPELAAEDVSLQDVLPVADDTPAELIEPESFQDTAVDLPMLSNSMRIDGPITPAPADTGNDIAEEGASQEPDRKSSLPDLEALEAAISAARGGEPRFDQTDTQLPELHSEPAEATIEPELSLAPQPETVPFAEIELESVPARAVEDTPPAEEAELPEITLDNSIDQSLEDQENEGQELDQMAAELANVESLEDISDVMAETLFGIEFEQIAQEALKNPPATGTLPSETEVPDSPVIAAATTSANDPGDEPSPVMLDQDEEPSPVMLDPEEPVSPPPTPVPTAAPPQEPVARVSAPIVHPDSLEDQFKTDITQTTRAIDPANPPDLDDNDDEDKPGGLFGRLKKTFRS
jgi:general secretion pathway protein A